MPDTADKIHENMENVGTPCVSRERIQELVGRLRGTGGLKLKPPYAKNLTSWLNTLSKRGYLHVQFLKDREMFKDTFLSVFPNPNTRSQYTHAMLSYFSALTDDDFQQEYLDLSREEAVESVRQVAAQANKHNNDRLRISKRGPNAVV
jgi:hypothetical protein